MAQNKTRIQVTTVFDGELDATDAFMSLIVQKYQQKHTKKEEKEYLAISQEIEYNKDEVQKNRVPSGLCG